MSAACTGLARGRTGYDCSLYGRRLDTRFIPIFLSLGITPVALSRRACQGVFFRGRLVASREAAGSVFTGEVVPGVALSGVAPVVLDSHTSHNPRSGFPYVDTRYYIRRMSLCRLCSQWPCRRVVVRLTGGSPPWSAAFICCLIRVGFVVLLVCCTPCPSRILLRVPVLRPLLLWDFRHRLRRCLQYARIIAMVRLLLCSPPEGPDIWFFQLITSTSC